MDNHFELDVNQKLSFLLNLYDKQYIEFQSRRDRELKIFLWTATIIIGIISMWFTIPQFREMLSSWQWKLGATIAVVLLCVFSIIWQNRERKFSYDNCKVIVHIHTILHAFDANYYSETPLLPKDWEKWGNNSVYTISRFFTGNFITALEILTIALVLLIWIG